MSAISSWPLQKISEPHDTNDVVLSSMIATSTSADDSNNGEGGNGRHISGSSWYSILENTDNGVDERFKGNQRFLDLLKGQQHEYASKSRLEKPFVAVDLLKQWRKQSPPGRFLVVEDKTDPPLWKDVGDKTARSYISKALKHINKNKSVVVGGGAQKSDAPAGGPAVVNSNVRVINEKETLDCDPDKVPALPKFPKPLKNDVRRISRVLSSARADGKLYGRQEQRRALVEIFQRQKQKPFSTAAPVVDLVLISGEMGVGKSSLAWSLMNPQQQQQQQQGLRADKPNMRPFAEPAFFLHGKFEQLKSSDPNAAFAAFITDFCTQVRIQNDPLLMEQYRSVILDAFKDCPTLLTNLVPALEGILNVDDNDNDYSSSSGSGSGTDGGTTALQAHGALATQRVKLVFGMFLRAIAGVDPQSSIVVLLEDIHWASEAALDILTFLVTDVSNRGILFIGTFRDDDAKNALTGDESKALFDKVMRQWDLNQHVQVHSIHLENLDEGSVQDMLAETLLLEHEHLRSLNQLVFSLTKGNPIFIAELLRNFQEEGLLRFDDTSSQWKCDLHMIPLTLDGIDNVIDLFRAKLVDLRGNVQKTLKVAACLGSSQLDESILKLLDKNGNVPSHLKHAASKGLLQERGETYLFVSDGVQQAAYNLIPSEHRGSYHLNIGQKLWHFLEERQDEEFLSVLLGQLMLGDHLLTEESDRRAVASLCLKAGEKNAKSSSFQTARVYLSHGISILPTQKMWGRDNYDLSLRLHNAAIEVCYCNADFVQLDTLVETVLEVARSFEDSMLARSTQIYSLGSRNKLPEAIDKGLHVLRELGEQFPLKNPSMLQLFLAMRRTKRSLRGMSDEAVLRLPPMRDSKKLAAMQILNHLILYTFYARPPLSALVIFRMVEMTVKWGVCAMSSISFAFYGMLLCGWDRIDIGYRYGKLSLKLYDAFKTEAWLCRTSAAFYGCVYSWKNPVEGAIEPLRRAYRVGLSTGDIEYAMLCASMSIWNGSESIRLPILVNHQRELAGQMIHLQQSLALSMLKPLWQACLNFMGQAVGDPKVLQGELIDDEIEKAKGGSNDSIMLWVNFSQMKLGYMFNDYDFSERFSKTSHLIYDFGYGGTDSAFVLFYECAVLLAQARRGKRRRRHVAYVLRRLKRLQYWAMESPVNFLSRQYIIQAELAVVRGDHQSALSNYRSAILHSREGGSELQEALANERLGRYHLEQGDRESGRVCLEKAYHLYTLWGGIAKAEHLKQEHSSLLVIN